MENSGYPFPAEKYIKLAKEFGKRFEFLYRELTDEQVGVMQERGKSWGEADLIDYAMRNSKLIDETDVIYKITGRVFIRNSKSIIRRAYKQSEFRKSLRRKWAKAEFFKVLKSDYFKYLSQAKDVVNDYLTDSIEAVWFKYITNSDMEVKAFKVYPRLEGQIGGGNGLRYERAKLEYVIYDLLPYCLKKPWRVK